MNISKELVLIVMIITVLFYALSEGMIEFAENFGIINDEIEGFCAGPNCGNHRNHHRRRYNNDYNNYNNYYNSYYNSYNPYYDPYYGHWYNIWGYLPCVSTPFGSTYCW